jgi:hypothetical protein
MLERLRLHTSTHLRFYVRNRLLLGFALIVLALWTLGLVPFFLMVSSGDRFDTLRTLSGQIRSYAWFYTAALGLFALWSHVSNRSVTLVFTRPGAPEIWLGSIFLSVFLVALAVQAVGVAVTFVLSVAWDIPYQAGFLWLTLDSLLETVIVVSALTALASAIHPVIALLVFIVFNEDLLFSLDTMLLGAIDAWGPSPILSVIERGVRAIQVTVPWLDPFASQTGAVESSLRVTPSDWGYLAATAGYAAATFVFFFLFADYFLRRRTPA